MLCSPCAQVPGSQWVGSVGMNTLGKRELCVGKKAEGPCLEQMWNGLKTRPVFSFIDCANPQLFFYCSVML